MAMINSPFSILFSISYLVIIWSVLLKTSIENFRTDMFKKRDATWKWTFIAYFLLGFGDIFHLGSRIYLFFSPGGFDTPSAELLLGWGSIITGITITYFYLAIFHAWEHMYDETYSTEQRQKYFFILYGAFVTRLLLMALPYNHWFGGNARGNLDFNFSLITSIPLYIVGILTIYLLLKTSTAEKAHPSETINSYWNEGNYKASLAYLFSYIMFSLTLFLSETYPLAGVFMIPKTVAYLVALYYHYTRILTVSSS